MWQRPSDFNKEKPKRTTSEYKERAREQWYFWRLIMDEKITYTEASQMDWDELLEANAALDIYIEKLNKKK